MSSEFAHLLAAAPDVVERERLLAIYLIRAEQLLDIAEECRANWIAALEAAAEYEQRAERIARLPVDRLRFDSLGALYHFQDH